MKAIIPTLFYMSVICLLCFCSREEISKYMSFTPPDFPYIGDWSADSFAVSNLTDTSIQNEPHILIPDVQNTSVQNYCKFSMRQNNSFTLTYSFNYDTAGFSFVHSEIIEGTYTYYWINWDWFLCGSNPYPGCGEGWELQINFHRDNDPEGTYCITSTEKLNELNQLSICFRPSFNPDLSIWIDFKII